jgi:hypothetical protein
MAQTGTGKKKNWETMKTRSNETTDFGDENQCSLTATECYVDTTLTMQTDDQRRRLET